MLDAERIASAMHPRENPAARASAWEAPSVERAVITLL
jgi:hypothetical protein